MKKRKLPLWAVLLWLLVWQAASMALDSDILLVSPLRVIATLLALLPTARFWASLLGSMARILGGFFLAAALGTLLAALAARFKRVEEWLAPPVLAMKTVPVASFVILALIWFGSRNLSVFIALVMVFPVIYTNVLAGVRAADRELAEMARVFRIPLLRRIRCITLPQVAPYFRAASTQTGRVPTARIRAAPRSAAPATAMSPTGPIPTTSTVSPNCTSASSAP